MKGGAVSGGGMIGAHVPIQRDQSFQKLVANGRPMGPLHCEDGVNKEWGTGAVFGMTKKMVRIIQKVEAM